MMAWTDQTRHKMRQNIIKLSHLRSKEIRHDAKLAIFVSIGITLCHSVLMTGYPQLFNTVTNKNS